MKTLQNSIKALLFGIAVASSSFCITANAIVPPPTNNNSCTYRVHPTSVIRTQPGSGFIYGQFTLVSSQGVCPITQASVLQFSNVFDGPNSALIFRPALETCLNTASLLVVPISGSFIIQLANPYQTNTGVLVVNSQPGGLEYCQIRSN